MENIGKNKDGLIEYEIKNVKYAYKEIIKIGNDYNFNEVFAVFKDILYDSRKENNEKTLFGYFLNKKLIGNVGIKKNIENIKVTHFGIHSEYCGKNMEQN